MLLNDFLVSIMIEGRSNDWPPIQEPWRCLEESRKDTFKSKLRDSFIELSAEPDCPLITDDVCEAETRYPVPCK